VRVSTIEGDLLDKWAKQYEDKVFIQQYVNWYYSQWYLRAVTEDSAMIHYMPLHSSLYPIFYQGLKEHWSGEKIASEMEKTLWNVAEELGYT